MSQTIRQQPVTEDLKQLIQDGFKRHALEKTGMDGMMEEAVSFVAYDGKKVVGVLVAALFWGQLRIKNLIFEEAYRERGIASELMARAHAYGLENGTTVSFLETMDFQAPGFYEKLGYKTEFARTGYAANASFIFMRKDLK